MDTPVLDGLPRVWADVMGPGRDRDPHIQKAAPSPTRVNRHSSTPDIVEKASPFKLEAEPEPEPSVALRLDTTESLLPEGGPLQTSSAQEGPPSPPRSSRVLSKLDDPSVRDIGWHDGVATPPVLVSGITNTQVFMLIRRFNKVRRLFKCRDSP